LQSVNAGWFYIQVVAMLNSSEAMCDPTIFVSSNLVHPGIFQAYLRAEQASCLSSRSEVQLWTVERKRWRVRDGDDLMVRAAPGWSHPAVKAARGSGLFIVDARGAKAASLRRDPAVLSVRNMPQILLANRYTAGLLRGGDAQNVLNWTHPRLNWAPPRYKFGELQGAGQVITVVDTGLDITHPFSLIERRRRYRLACR
jgi:hypothetical protein